MFLLTLLLHLKIFNKQVSKLNYEEIVNTSNVLMEFPHKSLILKFHNIRIIAF